MKRNVVLEISGGLIHRGLRYQAARDEMPPDAQSALEALTSKAPGTHCSPTARDARKYHLEVEKDSSTEMFTYDDTTVPEDILPLIKFLRTQAKN